MSQEKVDKHKSDKKNRKKLNKQARMRSIAAAAIGLLVCAALAVWIGFSVYGKVTSSGSNTAEVSGTPIDIDPITDYIGSLN